MQLTLTGILIGRKLRGPLIPQRHAVDHYAEPGDERY